MSRGWKVALGVGAVVVAINLLLAAVHSLTGGTPGGPTSSSYATGDDGLAAYAELLADAGHRVERLRVAPAESRLTPDATVVLLDGGFVGSNDTRALRQFVQDGGRLVAGGENADWVRRIVRNGPVWSSTRARGAEVLATVPEVAGVVRVTGLGSGSWSRSGAALPVLGTAERALLAVSEVGEGRVALLADARPIQNVALTQADNAALGLALAGAGDRPVVFLESFHGYGRVSGLAAIPDEWWLLFALMGVAVAALILARGRRLGPPEETARALPPPRLEYVESLGGVLARTRGRAEVAEPLREEAVRLLRRRLALGGEEGDVEAAAARLGLPPDEARALSRPARTDEDLLAVGRAYTSLARGEWSS